MTSRLLLIDDDARLSAMVGDYLRNAGFDITVAASLAAGRVCLAGEPFDALVLDLMLPDGDGLDLCRELRAQPRTRALPLLMLTARGEPMDRIVGLELGADDYLGKPFEPRELVARIRAVLRRGRAERVDDRTTLHFGGWDFDRLRRQLRAPDGSLVSLSTAEFRLLGAFVAHPGRVLSRERLLDLTRASGADVNDRSIDLAVSRLRGKLADGDVGSGGGMLIRTLRGEGYLFDVKVS